MQGTLCPCLCNSCVPVWQNDTSSTEEWVSLDWKEVNDCNVSENVGCYLQLAVVSLLLAMLAPMGCAYNITHTFS